MPAKKSHTEDDRIRRIRDAQIASRDPGPSKIPKYDWGKHAQRQAQIIRKRKSKTLFSSLYEGFPARIRGAIVGIAFGMIFVVLAQIFLTGEWVALGLLAMIVCGIIGFVIGSVMQNNIEKW